MNNCGESVFNQVISEKSTFEGETHYIDVLPTDWFVQYVEKAHDLGLLDKLVTENDDEKKALNPHKYITREEIIYIIE